jgi:hypothetical protein
MCSEWCNLQRRCRHRRLLCERRAVRRNRESTSSSGPLAGDARGSHMGFDDLTFQKLVERNAGLDNMIQTCSMVGSSCPGETSSAVYRGTLAWSPITLLAWYAVNATGLSVNGEALPVSLQFERSLSLRSVHRRQRHQFPLLDRTGVRGHRPICK